MTKQVAQKKPGKITLEDIKAQIKGKEAVLAQAIQAFRNAQTAQIALSAELRLLREMEQKLNGKKK